AAPSPQAALVAMIEILQAMQVVQIPLRRRVLAVDFKRIKRLVASRVSRGLERRQRSVLEPAQERAGIVNPNRLDASGQIVFALLDERFGHRGHFGNRPVDRKSTRLNSSHVKISYAVFCLKKKNIYTELTV